PRALDLPGVGDARRIEPEAQPLTDGARQPIAQLGQGQRAREQLHRLPRQVETPPRQLFCEVHSPRSLIQARRIACDQSVARQATMAAIAAMATAAAKSAAPTVARRRAQRSSRSSSDGSVDTKWPTPHATTRGSRACPR